MSAKASQRMEAEEEDEQNDEDRVSSAAPEVKRSSSVATTPATSLFVRSSADVLERADLFESESHLEDALEAWHSLFRPRLAVVERVMGCLKTAFPEQLTFISPGSSGVAVARPSSPHQVVVHLRKSFLEEFSPPQQLAFFSDVSHNVLPELLSLLDRESHGKDLSRIDTMFLLFVNTVVGWALKPLHNARRSVNVRPWRHRHSIGCTAMQ